MNKCIKVVEPTRKAQAGVSKPLIKVLALARLEAIASGKPISEDARWLAAWALKRADQLTIEERRVCTNAIGVSPWCDLADIVEELGAFLRKA